MKMPELLDNISKTVKDELDDTNMTDVYYTPSEITQDQLSLTESNIKPDRNDMDLLYHCLPDWGLPLSMPHTHEKINVFEIFKLLAPNTNVKVI
ncbi:MAG: hypothetical protein FWF80_04250 [Defluviitaleaceae bacterium]|nr:hypothetical protein [Defluviitaleaceae bacterium]